MTLERMICSECGAQFDDDLFSTDPSETMVCPLCGTVALEAEPMEDRGLHIHAATQPHGHGAADPGVHRAA
jgi:rubredoxin